MRPGTSAIQRLHFNHLSSLAAFAVAITICPTLALAEGAEGCAAAVGPKDLRGRQTAILNAISEDLRSRMTPETAGSAQIVDQQTRVRISSVVSAKLKTARVVSEKFLADEDGKNPRICVSVVY